MRIIIVEDDEDDLNFLRESILLVHEVEITSVCDGLNLLNYLNQNNGLEAPAVIIMDLFLPLKNGFETLIELKASSKHCTIPVIILTSSVLQEQSCLEAGCARYYLKPNSMKEYNDLAEEIFRFLGEMNPIQ